MKTISLTLLLLPLSLVGFGQSFGYEIQGSQAKPVAQEILAAAKTMTDINPGYPESWIEKEDYISAEIVATCNGKTKKVVGPNNILSVDQRELLAKADLGSDIEVEVKYNSKNIVTEKLVVNTMKFSLRVNPLVDAEFKGGYEQLKEYLKEHTVDKIPEATAKKIKQASVDFVINEEGKAVDIEVSKTTKDEKIDKLLLETIRNMPAWLPARNSNCVKVRQKFTFTVGMSMGC